jgi:hypothetical protein
MLQRLGQWTRPGGWFVVVVDSLIALVLELLRAGNGDEALLRLENGEAPGSREACRPTTNCPTGTGCARVAGRRRQAPVRLGTGPFLSPGCRR